MKPFETVLHKGKKIVVIDISNSMPEQAVVALREAQLKISKMPANSVLILTDATNATYNKDSGDAIKEFVSKNTPYVKASAVVGADGIRAVLKNTVTMQNHREIASFSTQGEAMDWLAAK